MQKIKLTFNQDFIVKRQRGLGAKGAEEFLTAAGAWTNDYDLAQVFANPTEASDAAAAAGGKMCYNTDESVEVEVDADSIAAAAVEKIVDEFDDSDLEETAAGKIEENADYSQVVSDAADRVAEETNEDEVVSQAVDAIVNDFDYTAFAAGYLEVKRRRRARRWDKIRRAVKARLWGAPTLTGRIGFAIIYLIMAAAVIVPLVFIVGHLIDADFVKMAALIFAPLGAPAKNPPPARRVSYSYHPARRWLVGAPGKWYGGFDKSAGGGKIVSHPSAAVVFQSPARAVLTWHRWNKLGGLPHGALPVLAPRRPAPCDVKSAGTSTEGDVYDLESAAAAAAADRYASAAEHICEEMAARHSNTEGLVQ